MGVMMARGACARQRPFDTYVDTTQGVNGSGTRASPFNVWSSVPSTANKRIGVKRNSSFREEIAPKADGWLLGSYGAGALPRVYGSDEVTGWTAYGSSTDVVTNGGLTGSYDATDPTLEDPPSWDAQRSAGTTSVVGATASPPGGFTKYIVIANDASNSAVWLDQTVALVSGSTYVLVVQAQRGGGTQTPRFSLQESTNTGGQSLRYLKAASGGSWGSGSELHSLPAPTTSWGQLSSVTIITITAPSTGNFRLRLQNSSGGSGSVLRLTGIALTTGGGPSADVWYASVATLPGHVIDMPTPGDVDSFLWMARRASIADVDAMPGSWFHDAGVLYVHVASGGDPSTHQIEGSQRNRAMQVFGRTNTTVRHMQGVFAKQYGLQFQIGSGDPCTNALAAGIDARGNKEIGINYNCASDDSTGYRIADCYTERNGRKGIEAYGRAHSGVIEDNVTYEEGANPNATAGLQAAGQPSDGTALVADPGDSRAGIDLIASDLGAGGGTWDVPNHVQRSTNTVVRRNNTSRTGRAAGVATGITGTGIWFDHPGANCHAYDNDSYDNLSRGLNLECASEGGCTMYHNRTWGQNTGSGTGIIMSRGAQNAKVANNSIYNCARGIWCQSQQDATNGDPAGFDNNDVANNLIVACTVDLYILDGAANGAQGAATGSGAGNTYRKNLIGVNRTNVAQHRLTGPGTGATNDTTLAALVAAVPTVTGTLQSSSPGVSPPPDLLLTTGSPAINAGHVIAPITDGYLGAAPDIGAHEFA